MPRRLLKWQRSISVVIMGVLAVIAVIQAQKARDTELLAQRTLYGACDPVIICDEHSNVLLFNPAAEAMFGYTCDEIKQLGMRTIIPRKFWKAHDEGMKMAASRLRLAQLGWTTSFRAQIAAQRRDGTEFPARMSVSGSCVGKRVQFMAIIRNATTEDWPKIAEQKKLEKACEQLRLICGHR